MPAIRRQSSPKAAHAEPYPTPIKPGDKAVLLEKSSSSLNKSTESTKSSVFKSSPSKDPTSKDTTPTPSPKSPQANPQGVKTYLEIKLPGEDTDNVPIHDTCSEVRRKINSLLSKDNQKPENAIPGAFKKDGTGKPWTKTKFCEVLGVSTRMMDTFMKAKKLMGGAESAVYPAAYRFFERKRIFEGKAKTKGRLKVEADRPNGLKLLDPNKIWLTLGPGECAADFLDEYGQ